MKLFMWVESDEDTSRPDEIQVVMDYKVYAYLLDKMQNEIRPDDTENPATLILRGKIMRDLEVGYDPKTEIVIFRSQEK